MTLNKAIETEKFEIELYQKLGIDSDIGYVNNHISYVKWFEELKELRERTRWIPCSERLPSDEDYDETFTVTIQCEHVQDWDDYVTGYADWTPHGWDIQSYYMGQIEVIAWMSLPEPYKEVEE